jgi:predicted transcriptional regulator
MPGPGASSPPNTAADIMTPNPRTCSTFSTVLEAVMIFRDADCGAVPVLDNGKAVGILTDRDVALALADKPDLATRLVNEIMSSGVASVAPETPIEVVRGHFGAQGVRRLLVVDSREQLLGIIAWADVAKILPDRAIGQMVSEVVEQA